MAKRKSKKKSTSLGQWILVALGALLLYRGLQYFLAPRETPAKKPPVVERVLSTAEPHASPSPSPTPLKAPLAHWDFQSAARLLPDNAYPDNYLSILVKDSQGGLLAYAKVLPGKKPGPQGLTHTQPGLSFFRWKENQYQGQALNFSQLEPALPGIPLKKLTGLPQVEKKPWIEGETEVFPAKLFLEDDPREVSAWIAVGPGGVEWAPLQTADGKSNPAAFLQGTTRDLTRQVRTEKHDGKNYLIVETGKLDLARAYEGYRWKVEAYAWEGNKFVFDKEYSEQLTKEKKTTDH